MIVIGSGQNVEGWQFFGNYARHETPMICWGASKQDLVSLKSDNEVAAVSVGFDHTGRPPRFELHVRVPARLKARIGGRGSAEVRGVAGLDLAEFRGELTLNVTREQFRDLAQFLRNQLGYTYLPFMNDLFGSRPLAIWSWAPPLVLSIVIFLAVEALKAVRRRGDAFIVGS